MATKIRFYLDENVPIVVATQLKRRNIEAVTVRDLGLLGDSDLNHLQRATEMGFVLCTHDTDYVELATSGIEHAGYCIWSATSTRYWRLGQIPGISTGRV